MRLTDGLLIVSEWSPMAQRNNITAEKDALLIPVYTVAGFECFRAFVCFYEISNSPLFEQTKTGSKDRNVSVLLTLAPADVFRCVSECEEVMKTTQNPIRHPSSILAIWLPNLSGLQQSSGPYRSYRI